jgi:FtsP/CotA-like multicopper oxidase with cupredoxin domain
MDLLGKFQVRVSNNEVLIARRYHSHYSAQYSGGVYGAMIIHGPNDSPKCAGYDEDLGPVLVGDWYHKSYFQLVNQTMSPKGGPPQSQSNLVNGRANYPCQNTTKACTPNAGLSKFKFESGKKYRMRLINPSSEALQKISIDGHKFKVIAQDFVPLVPYETDLITLSVGQRTDVIVEATGDSKSSFWFRSTLQANGKSCSLVDGINSNATAVIYYEDASPNAIPKSTSTITADRILNCENDPAANSVPLFPLTSEPVGELFTQTFNIDLFNNGTHNLWAINNITARVDYEVSQLYEASQGTLKPQPQWNLYTLPQSAGTARLILYNSFPFAGHPMHLHGHNFQVLAQGHGVWDGIITSPENPSRRDVIELPAALPNNAGRGYTVIQFVLDNPAIQIFHCHLAWHVSAGLYSALVEKPEDIRKFKVPDSIPDGCRKWADFGKTTVVDQIDSGV